MKCREVRDLLVPYLDGEVNDKEKGVIGKHLSRCECCREEMEDLAFIQRKVTHALKQTVEGRGCPDHVWAGVQQRLIGERRAEAPALSLISRMRGGIDTMIQGLVSRQPVRIRPALIAVPVAAILVALLILSPWSVPLGPGRLIAEAYAATAGLQSYRVAGSSICIIGGETSEAAFAMKFAAPDRYHTKITIDGALHEFIVIGDKQFNRRLHIDQEGKGAVTFTAADMADILSKEKTLELLGQLTDLERLPDEKIDGVDCFVYRGRVDEPGEMEIEVKLWIGKDDYLIRQMRVETEVVSEDIEAWSYPWISVMKLRFYDFNEPIEIKPPKTPCGELLPGWQLVVDGYPKGVAFDELPLSFDVTFTISGDDPARQEISYRITISNALEETVSDVRLSLVTRATNEESGWIWNSPGPVTLEPGESKTYHIAWEFDATHTSKEELSRLVDNTTKVLVFHTTPEGDWASQIFFPGPA